MTFLLATAIENAYPTLADGRRVDQMDRCGHYAHWEEDFELVRELGLGALRYGPAYYRTHLAPDSFDWECCDEQLARLRTLGISVIADLCHFGVPNWLGGFQDPAFPVLFAEYARAFARRYPWIRLFTPVAEILRCASRSALRGEWNEREASDASFVRAMRNLCMAHELAVEAILSERPDAVIVQSETIEPPHASGMAAGEPERWSALRFLSLDLTMGHELAPGAGAYLHAHGVTSNDLSFFRERRAVGQRWLAIDHAAGIPPRDASRPATCRDTSVCATAMEYHARYHVPLFRAESPHEDTASVSALHERWRDAQALHAAGIPVPGFAWPSLTDVVGYANGVALAGNPVREVGLCTLGRDVRPVAEELCLLGAGGLEGLGDRRMKSQVGGV